MPNHLSTALLTLALAASVFIGPAAAQRACPAGLEWTAGMCTTAGLASSLTKRSVLADHAKINAFIVPGTPQDDRASPHPADAAGFEQSQPGNGSTNPNPRSP